MELSIRSARPSDADSLHRMLCDLEKEDIEIRRFTDVFLTNLRNENILYLVAELDNQPVGMASCHVQPLLHHAAPVGEIQEMYVNPSLRSQGIGHELIRVLLHFARQRGACQLEVTTNQIRLDTHRFYEREGFQKSHFKMVMKDLDANL